MLLQSNVLCFWITISKKVMQKGWSYIKDSGYFIKKINNLDSITGNAILLTVDMMGLYPSTPDDVGLTALAGDLD